MLLDRHELTVSELCSVLQLPQSTVSRHLKTLSGPAFDKAYIDHEVAYHQQVIDAMDKTLVPNAQNAELKALLVKVRPAFVAHLEHAKGLQGSLEAKGTAPHSQKAG